MICRPMHVIITLGHQKVDFILNLKKVSFYLTLIGLFVSLSFTLDLY